MRALVEGHVEVFALLRGTRDASADDGILEGGRGGADFAVDDGVVVGGTGGDGAVEGVFAEEVDYTGDFADLGESVSWISLFVVMIEGSCVVGFRLF